MKSIVRRLRAYQKDGDDLVIEIELPPLEITYLQNLFGIEKDDPMYDAYDVHEKQKVELEKYIDTEIYIDKYDYFLE
jgi:hypothetical protein